MYRQYKIKKRKGGFRTITEPSDSLSEMLSYLKVHLDALPMSEHAHGFIVNKSIITNALPHRNKRYVLNLDVKNFFPSVRRPLMMEKLAPFFNEGKLPLDIRDWIHELCFFEGALPQGSPTSPVLSNLYIAEIDEELVRVAGEMDCTYTRYADDMTFSGGDVLKSERDKVAREVDLLLQRIELKLHPRKVKLMPYYQRQIVTGIVVNNEKLTLPRWYKEELFLATKGEDPSTFDEQFRGVLEYVRSVDSQFYKKMCNHMIAPKENEDGNTSRVDHRGPILCNDSQ